MLDDCTLAEEIKESEGKVITFIDEMHLIAHWLGMFLLYFTLSLC